MERLFRVKALGEDGSVNLVFKVDAENKEDALTQAQIAKSNTEGTLLIGVIDFEIEEITKIQADKEDIRYLVDSPF